MCKPNRLRFSILITLALALFTAPLPAFAQWNFGNPEECSPLVSHETMDVAPPAVMIMLDKSGSMDWKFNGYTTQVEKDKRWYSAKQAIKTLTQSAMGSTPNSLEFGLGLFGTSSKPRPTVYDYTQASIRLEAKPNASTDIMTILNNTTPIGGTPTAEAIQKMYTSETVKGTKPPYQNRSTAGLLVTDGEPNDQLAAVNQACEHRKIATMYVIGMGIPQGKQFNDILAAAGGSGTCTLQDICTVNNLTYSKVQNYRGKCSGSYQTDNPAQLQTALTEIASAISCTYPLTVLGGGSVPADTMGCEGYDCVSVSLNGGIGRIYHENSTNTPKGWTWASTTERKNVKLNEYYCQKVQNRTARIVDTQVACLCTEAYDTHCNVLDADTCECPTGRWTCNYGTDECRPSTPGSCGTPLVGEGQQTVGIGICQQTGGCSCDADGRLNCTTLIDKFPWEGDACHVSTFASTNKHSMDMAQMLNPNLVKKERTRCNVGVASCENGMPQCTALTPMPEMCNGLDDDCDGLIDNLANSHTRYTEKTRFPEQDQNQTPLAPERPVLSDAYEAAACFERDICRCPDGFTDITSDAYLSDDYEDFLSSYWKAGESGKPTCICSSGLTD